MFTRLLLLAALIAAPAAAQTSDKTVVATIEQLFDAMRRADTAAVRASFLPNARVIVMPSADSLTDRLAALSLDDFVRFTGQNGPNVWNETLSNPVVRTNGALSHVWFDYDVRRGSAFSHCGVNSVQLEQTRGGWKIVSMAFTSRRTSCTS